MPYIETWNVFVSKDSKDTPYIPFLVPIWAKDQLMRIKKKLWWSLDAPGAGSGRVGLGGSGRWEAGGAASDCLNPGTTEEGWARRISCSNSSNRPEGEGYRGSHKQEIEGRRSGSPLSGKGERKWSYCLPPCLLQKSRCYFLLFDICSCSCILSLIPWLFYTLID